MSGSGGMMSSSLLALEPGQLGLVWPAERVVLGLRVCKQLHKDLLQSGCKVLLVKAGGTKGANVDVDVVTQDLRRFGVESRIAIKWYSGQIEVLFKSLTGRDGDCKSSTEAGLDRLKITELSLCSNQIGTACSETCAAVLRQCHALCCLDLCLNELGAEGVFTLAKALDAERGELQRLTLNWNNMGSDGAESLANGLRGCKSLTRLDLRGNGIGKDGAKRLAAALTDVPLTHLDLSVNDLQAEGAGVLVGTVAATGALRFLNLSENDLGKAVETLAAALSHCTLLTHLDLSCNGLFDEGVEHLADALVECRELKHLELGDNGIQDAGVYDLAQALRHCTKLKHLHIGWYAARMETYPWF